MDTFEERHELLKSDVQAALGQSRHGLSEQLDMDAITRELIDELDEQDPDVS